MFTTFFVQVCPRQLTSLQRHNLMVVKICILFLDHTFDIDDGCYSNISENEVEVVVSFIVYFYDTADRKSLRLLG